MNIRLKRYFSILPKEIHGTVLCSAPCCPGYEEKVERPPLLAPLVYCRHHHHGHLASQLHWHSILSENVAQTSPVLSRSFIIFSNDVEVLPIPNIWLDSNIDQINIYHNNLLLSYKWMRGNPGGELRGVRDVSMSTWLILISLPHMTHHSLPFILAFTKYYFSNTDTLIQADIIGIKPSSLGRVERMFQKLQINTNRWNLCFYLVLNKK